MSRLATKVAAGSRKTTRRAAPAGTGTAPRSELLIRIRKAIALAEQAEAAQCAIDEKQDPEDHERACAITEQRWAALGTLEEQIPHPPRALHDLVARAEVAYYWADKTLDGERLAALADGAVPDCTVQPATRLVEAVLLFANARQG